ncbi:nuclear pore complex protein Nup98-Nup96 [Wyeomyia smithii]|uniref:nuclear pore complex protein Nup98-Nup96 n=1 Tax=Wyeomyia smithii TaxID=174621 RepID=UPI002467DEFD|nr:nuclear pore complex protein Nup98-Nup96 [Wyeomyia smithii]XP_055550082.1 nuclear pore complex protein Nup98-Nup96 [Wyeomyia smithii]
MFGAKPGGFGQTSAASGFGTFGTNTATASPFGQTNTFGKPATAGAFGATPAFGQQANTSLFGQTQPATGLFGASTSAAPAFGAPATTQSGFGTFGQQQQQTTSLFGTQNNTAPNTTLFGANNNNSAFGAAKPAGFGGFGQTAPQTSLFGQASTSQTATGGFFGQNTQSGGLFGAPKNAFGATAPVGAGNGTAVVKYQQTPSTDTLVKNGQTNTVQTKQHCITFMKEYENKSVEELRYEDYAANRKGPQAGSTPGGFFGTTAVATPFGATATQPQSLFGQATTSQPSTGLFGTTTNTFGQTTAPAFGATQNAGFGKPFGSATTSSGFGFGQTNTNTMGGLGTNKPAFGTTTGLFGQPAAPAANTFGQPSAFGGFGTQNQPQQAGSLFSGTATSTAPGASAFGGLGTQTTQTGFGFGSNTATMTAGGGLFGAKPAANTFGTLGSSFGQNQTSTAPAFGGFGTNTTTAGSLFANSFNKPAAPAFGLNTTTSTGTFGGGLNFGAGSGSLFGNTANKPGTLGTGSGLFGNTSALGGGTGAFGALGTNSFGTGLGTNTGLGNLGQPAQPAVPIHQQILAMVTSPYGDNPIFKDIKPLAWATEDSLKPTNPSAQKAILEGANQQFKVSPKVTGSGVKVKPVGSATLSKKSLFEGLEEYDSTLEESFTLKPNAKRLIIKPKSTTPTITIQNRSSIVQTNIQSKEDAAGKESFQNQIPVEAQQGTSSQDTSRRVSWLQSNALEKVRQINRMSDSVLDSTIKEFALAGGLQPSSTTMTVKEASVADSSGNSPPVAAGTSSGNDSGHCATVPNTSSPVNMNDSSLMSSSNRSFLNDTASASGVGDVSAVSGAETIEDAEPHPTGIVLRRPGYYTIPTLDDILQLMDEEGRCVVPNFTIGRRGYGNVYFNEPIDVANLNLDEIVHFRHKEVIIYPDDENKPLVGEGLNRKAQITLDQVWPHDKALHEPIKDPHRLALMEYEGKLRRVCDKHDTRFLEYRPDTGSWVFKVDHFSKYGLSDSDEDETPADPKKSKMMVSNEMKLPSKETGAIQKKPQASTLFNREKASMQHEDFNFSLMNDSLAPTSPTAALALGMGTDSHKLQLMKASFFVEDDFDRRSVLSEMTDGGRDSPDQTVPNKPFLGLGRTLTSSLYLRKAESPTILETDSMQLEDFDQSAAAIFATSTSKNLQEQMFQARRKDTPIDIPRPIGPRSLPLILKPRVELVHSNDIVIPFQQSILNRFVNNKTDLAFFQGRKFKVGWSFPASLVLLSSSENCSQLKKSELLPICELQNFFRGRSVQDYSPAVLQMLQIGSSVETVDFQKTVEDHLKIELKYDEVRKMSNSDCPYYVPGGKYAGLADHYETTKMLADSFDAPHEALCVEVWSLCAALWGAREELEDVDDSAHLSTMFRRDLFSEWIEAVVTEKSSKELAAALQGKKQDYLDQLLELVCTHKILDACELAFENDDVNLSMLLAQISGGPTIRQLIQHQLSSWQDVEADSFIDVRRLKLFMLIAGIPLLSSTHGTINIFEQLDWLKSLALHLWYLCSPTASITDALLNYESSFQSNEFFALPPTPNYTTRVLFTGSKPIHDIRFHLLKLYSKRSHPMEALLNPATHTPDPLDFRLSWFLMQTLETLGYRHCSELSRSQLHLSFANQLENHGMWHWAIYVLLHLNDQSRRELSIQDLLYRHIELSTDEDYLEREQFVVGDLGIPEKWIFWAKAVRAGAQFDYHQQACFLLKAKQWSKAHEVIMEHIAADCVINDDIPYLKTLLNEFEDVKQISNWSIKGQILRDFIELNEKFDLIRDAIDDDVAETRLEELKPKLSDLCSVIKMFPCPTPKHRLCQSEIAQRLAYLIRSFFSQDPQINSCALMRSALEKLPLPQEYALEELRHMLNAFLTEDLRKPV